MSLSNSERLIVVNLEMEKAKRTFDDMLFCLHEGKWEAAANRLYYALFHATRLNGVANSRSYVISELRRF